MPSRTSKMRGSRTHGRGHKSGRGAGIRGGRGNAGLHKHKYISALKCKDKYFGRRGFKRPNASAKTTINLSEIEKFAKRGIVDLTGLGYDKLLGKGHISKKLKIKVHEASKKAIEKVAQVGGEIVGGEK